MRYLLISPKYTLVKKQTNKQKTHTHTHKHTQMARILTRLGIGKSGLLETHHSCLISKRMLFNNTWNPVVGKYSSHVPVMMIFFNAYCKSLVSSSHGYNYYETKCSSIFEREIPLTFPPRWNLIYIYMCVWYTYRGASPAAGHRDSRWAGLVSGATRDAENPTLCQWDGFQQGTLTKH